MQFQVLESSGILSRYWPALAETRRFAPLWGVAADRFRRLSK
ncbi:hypothetical protein Z946_213 [Sulfitobacter noctilucicola]|nr:hypothetical protein Z946_213 [Sulfitobacter noctilucicola]